MWICQNTKCRLEFQCAITWYKLDSLSVNLFIVYTKSVDSISQETTVNILFFLGYLFLKDVTKFHN